MNGYIESELKEMASGDDKVLTIRDFTELAASVKDVVKSVCNAVTEAIEDNEDDEKIPICHAGDPAVRPPECRVMPEPDFSSTTNTDYENRYGTPCAGEPPESDHVCDGEFTSYTPGGALTGEWAGVTPAIGRFTYAYITYDGTHLHILNDWIYNDVAPVNENCYNLFNAWTGGGKEWWTFKVFGSGKVEVILNGKVVDQTEEDACGNIGYTYSPKQQNVKHSIFELSFKASPGRFGVQLHDPGPRFACDVVETEPAVFIGHCPPDGGCSYTAQPVELFDPRTKWCYKGGPLPCKEVPPVPDSSSTNTYYTYWYGQRGRIINNNDPQYPHVCDGEFTDYGGKGTALQEWSGVTAAKGRFTNAYFNYDGERLHILNDWIYNDVNPVASNCYNLFNAWTGSGRERWELKVYGSGKVEVRLNNVLVDQADPAADTCGNITFGYSPARSETKHTIFELSFRASPGSFGVQLHDPGPRFGCDVIETEPTTFIGELEEDGGCDFTTGTPEDFEDAWDNLPPIGYWDTSSTTATTTTTTKTQTTATTITTTKTLEPDGDTIIDYTCSGDTFEITSGKDVATYRHRNSLFRTYTASRRSMTTASCRKWCADDPKCVGYHYGDSGKSRVSFGRSSTTCNIFFKQDNTKWTLGSSRSGFQVGIRKGCRTGVVDTPDKTDSGSPPTSTWTPTSTCAYATDVIFVLDQSGSIDDSEWDLMKSFVDRLMQSFSGNVRFGLMSYDSKPRLSWHINDGRVNTNYQNNKAARDLLARVKKSNCGFLGLGTCKTDTGEAMEYVENAMMRKRRYNGIPLIVVTISDGAARDPDVVKTWSKKIQDAGVVMMSVKIGSWADTDNSMNALASEPKSKRKFQVTDFSALANEVKAVHRSACDAVNPIKGGNGCFDYKQRWNVRHSFQYNPIYTAEECQKRCKAKSSCKFFYYKVNSRTCYLQTDAANKQKVFNQLDTIMGPRNCPGLDSVHDDMKELQELIARLTGENSGATPTPAPTPAPQQRPSCYEENTMLYEKGRKKKFKAYSYPVSDVETCQKKCYAQKKWIWIRWCKYYTYNAAQKYCYMYTDDKGTRRNDRHSTSAKVSCKGGGSSSSGSSGGGAGGAGGGNQGVCHGVTQNEKGCFRRQRRDKSENGTIPANEPVVFDQDEEDFDCSVDPSFYGPGASLPKFCDAEVKGDSAVVSVALEQAFEDANAGDFQSAVIKLIAEKAGVRPARIGARFSTAGSVIVSSIIKEGDDNETKPLAASQSLQAAIESGNFSVNVTGSADKPLVQIKPGNETVFFATEAMTSAELTKAVQEMQESESQTEILFVDESALDEEFKDSEYNPANIPEGGTTPKPPSDFGDDDGDDADGSATTPGGTTAAPQGPSQCENLRAHQVFFRCTDISNADVAIPGCYVVECAADGSFVKKQCHESECWCVTETGDEMVGTRAGANATSVDCDSATGTSHASGFANSGRIIVGTVIGVIVGIALVGYVERFCDKATSSEA